MEGFYMKRRNRLVLAGVGLAIALASSDGIAQMVGSGNIKHVLLLSIDGMHAVDFFNCTHGVAGVNGGAPYCPNLAALSLTGINYVNTESSKPSDSFPGMAALASGGTPKSTGLYYDVAYDRSLDAPCQDDRHWPRRRPLYSIRDANRNHD
jgi:predicted AlkP superfamily pyrophosphatase or phosphodiesterase